MQRIVGRLERLDLGAGGYVVTTADGGRVVLHGEVPDGWVGRQVRVSGRRSEGSDFLMAGDPALQVHEVALIE